MGQLLKVTSTPFQAIHFTQSARLVPTDSLDIERRKAMARHIAFNSRYSGGGSSIDLEYVNQVNRVFSTGHAVSKQPAAPLPGQDTGSRDIQNMPAPKKMISKTGAATEQSTAPAADSADSIVPSVLSVPVQSGNTITIPEAQAAYTMQRGSFELRVAKGELSYIPPLAMTIITQYPDIHFEYTGGFNYIPPREDNSENINFFI